jgi:hypothetical protein
LPEEDHSEAFKMTSSGYFESRYGVEWMKFDDDCPLPELIKTVAHVAFVVDYLDAAIADKKVIVAEVIVAPSSPAEGVRVAFIVDNGAPIEFLQFDKPESEIWPHPNKFEL